MTFAYYCVLLAALIPYLFVAYAKSTSAYLLRGGNKAPRNYGEELSGPRKRAYWAHLNGFEAFPPFAAAVIIASLTGKESFTLDLLAISFVVCRLLHGVFYTLDWDRLRSLAWFGGVACTVALFLPIP